MQRRQFLTGAGVAALAAAGDRSWAGSGEAAATPAAEPSPPGRERLSLDYGWRFFEGDIPFPDILTQDDSYDNAKAGNATGAAAQDYDDTGWREVDLPHDFAVEQPFDPNANVAEGFRRRGVGWYRRTLKLDPADRDRHLELQFDGVATQATVWVNGNLVHRNFSGYTSFRIDLTPFALFGEDLNTIAVRADATAMEGWWYEGAGIYRHVWLVKRDPVHIATDGLCAIPRRLGDGSWRVPVEAELANFDTTAADADLEVELFDPSGRLVAADRTASPVTALGRALARLSFRLDQPQLWSVEAPTLYRLRATLRRDSRVVDGADLQIGFRTLRFDARQGFFLNDQPLKIKGVCLHQDHAGVGVALPDSLWEFRLRRVKAMGANAIRCTHNAPAAELLDAADRLGLMVMDENRHFNVSDDVLPELDWMVRRDRNHPSIILWSVFNEESVQATEMGLKMVQRMVGRVKALDDTRPVTAAMNGGMFTAHNVSQGVDVVGFNYQDGAYDRFHALNPTRPMMSSEDTSAYMTRGEYATDKARHVLASYDEEAGVTTHRKAWKAIAQRPFVAGGFAWTGFDYRGEPTPFGWPTTSASFGILDLCGFPKVAFHIRRAFWQEAPVLELAPHWNWTGREGQPIKVMALTNCERVALWLNGELVSEQAVDPFEMATWQVPYAQGRLRAVGYRGGKIAATVQVETTGAPAALRLTPDRKSLAGDGLDAQPITVEALDAAGRPVPTANLEAVFEISGGRIIGVGNGDPNDHDPEKAARRKLYNGLAQVIVQTDRGGSGVLTLRAMAAGLQEATLHIPVRAAAAPAFVAPCRSAQPVTEWRTAPVAAIRPDPIASPTEKDLAPWGWAKPGVVQDPAPEGRYNLFRTTFRPRVAVVKSGGVLVFGRIAGAAEIWLDNRLIATKTDRKPERLAFPLPPGAVEHTLAVLFDAPPGSGPFGLAESVKVEEPS